MKLNALSQPWQQKRETNNRLNIRANSRFLWMHHPKNWELVSFDEQTEKGKKTVNLLLPSFTSLVATDGVNEVRTNGKRPDDSVARARFQNEGLTILDPIQYDYLVTYPAKSGTYYTDKFEILESIGGTIVKDYDRKAFNNFRRNLMKKKVFKLPHSHFIKLMIVDNRRSIDKYIKDQHIPENAVRLLRHQNIDKNLKFAIKQVERKGYSVYE